MSTETSAHNRASTLREFAQALRNTDPDSGPYAALTGYMADGWGFPDEDIDAAYADWLDKQAESIDDDNGFGPVHRWFAWHPVWTNTGWKWLRTITRQRRWHTYPYDPSFGNGGPEETLINWYWHHEEKLL